MKQFSNSIKPIATLLVGIFTSAVAWAQDSISAFADDFEIDTTVIDDGPYYAQLWFWIVIGIVFLLILVALIRGDGKKKVGVKTGEKTEKKMQVEDEEVEEKTQNKKVDEKPQGKKSDKED